VHVRVNGGGMLVCPFLEAEFQEQWVGWVG